MKINVAYAIGYQLGMQKRATMGCAVDPFSKVTSSTPSSPTRTGVKKTTRSGNMSRLNSVTRPAVRQ